MHCEVEESLSNAYNQLATISGISKLSTVFLVQTMREAMPHQHLGQLNAERNAWEKTWDERMNWKIALFGWLDRKRVENLSIFYCSAAALSTVYCVGLLPLQSNQMRISLGSSVYVHFTCGRERHRQSTIWRRYAHAMTAFRELAQTYAQIEIEIFDKFLLFIFKFYTYLASFTSECAKMKSSCWFSAHFALLIHLRVKKGKISIIRRSIWSC